MPGRFAPLARIAVEPRPYQLVPLLLALRLDPVRLLIADDVGVGKTIEACLIARELLDRGEIERLAVLCSPQLAPQWQNELRDKFHIDAEIVLPGTVTRLERNCRLNQSIFDLYPHVIVSTDFIKADRRRDEFLRACPEMVIVDEAHLRTATTIAVAGISGISSCRSSPRTRSAIILVTATPHSGNEAAFRSLLSMLHADFASLPEDLSGRENEPHRRRLAAHFVQRRRADIRRYLDIDTVFPERQKPKTRTGCRQTTNASLSVCSITRGKLSVTPAARCTVSGCAGGRPWRCCARWPPASGCRCHIAHARRARYGNRR